MTKHYQYIRSFWDYGDRASGIAMDYKGEPLDTFSVVFSFGVFHDNLSFNSDRVAFGTSNSIGCAITASSLKEISDISRTPFLGNGHYKREIDLFNQISENLYRVETTIEIEALYLPSYGFETI